MIKIRFRSASEYSKMLAFYIVDHPVVTTFNYQGLMEHKGQK
jgi:hypothetical protein